MDSSSIDMCCGFQNPVIDATMCFRLILTAISHPAQPVALPAKLPSCDVLNGAAVAIVLTLGDVDTNIYLAPECDTAATREYLKFHTGCAITDTPCAATFAVLTAKSNVDILDTLPHGTDEHPDRSATIILLCDDITNAAGHIVSGPGIQGKKHFNVARLPELFWDKIFMNHTCFPRGLDFIFASSRHIAALSRTSRLERS